MKDNNSLSWITSGITFLTAGLTTDLAQLILLILGIISSLVSLIYTLWKWYRKAKADDKITKEEIDEAVDIIHNHVKENDNEVK